MSFAFATFTKDVARWRQDPMQILLWLSVPLFIGGLITALMAGGDGARPTATLLLVDQDDSFLSGAVASVYGGGELNELIVVEQTTLEEGTTRINDGEASGLLVIPEGFSDAFLNNEPVMLTLKTNPSQTILPGIITNVTEVLLDAGFYVHALFGDEISTIMNSTDNVPDDLLVAGISVDINQKMETLAPLLFPPVIDVQIVEPPPEEPSPPLALLFMPGIVLMAIMFAANGIANDYWNEREHGTLRRLVIAPGQLTRFVAGKAMAASVTIGAVGAVTLAIGFVYHDVEWTSFLPSVIWVTLSGAVIFSWFAALQMMFSSQKAASVISTMVMFPLLMAGGSFFPLAVLPDWIAAMGRASPNGFVADRLTTELTAADAWTIDLQSWLIVLAAGVIGVLINVWRLRAGFARA